LLKIKQYLELCLTLGGDLIAKGIESRQHEQVPWMLYMYAYMCCRES
jgi:hypothetical protein